MKGSAFAAGSLGSLPKVEEIEGYARRLLERSGQERNDHPLPSRMFAALEKPPNNLRIIGDTPKGARGWYIDGTICVPDETPEDEVEDTIGHELVHWILTTTLDGVVKTDQDTIDDDVLLCARCPAHAVKRLIREHGIGLALQPIVSEWGHLDADEGFPLRLLIRATYLAEASVVVHYRRQRIPLGGSPYERNMNLAPEHEKKMVREVLDSGEPRWAPPSVIARPVTWQDDVAVVLTMEGGPSVGAWRG